MPTTGSVAIDSLAGYGDLPDNISDVISFTSGLASDSINLAIIGVGIVEQARQTMPAAVFLQTYKPIFEHAGSTATTLGALAAIGQAATAALNAGTVPPAETEAAMKDALESWAVGAIALIGGDFGLWIGLGLNVPPLGLVALGILGGIAAVWGLSALWDHLDGPTPLELLEGIPELVAGLPLGDLLNLDEIQDWISPLTNVIRDPLILDLDGDGIELTSLDGSAIHFDYDQDGFAERTGWVSADDGILVRDINGNGTVDGVGELFGSPTQDGFAVLETLDTNGDGVIDESDDAFAELHVWRDVNQNGITDAGEMFTLTEAGIQSILLIRTNPDGTNAGHTVGFQADFTFTDGRTGIAQTIYFETDRQDTVSDNTPDFVLAEGVLELPQLPGSGQINSTAWTASQDPAFLAAWETLTDQASSLSPDELRSAFEDILLKWADVEGVNEMSRGAFVDARHLAFIEKFFGTTYREVYAGNESGTSPSTQQFGNGIEASFDQIVSVLLTAFLAQVPASLAVRGAEITDILDNPYFAFSLLQFSEPSSEDGLTIQKSVDQALNLIIAMVPSEVGKAASYLTKSLLGLEGIVSVAFANNRDDYSDAFSTVATQISNPALLQVANAIVSGTAAIGTSGIDGLVKLGGDNTFIGGHGNDALVSGVGSDIFVYSQGDGSDYIRDTGLSLTDNDRMLLTDLSLTDLTFERVGDTLLIRVDGGSDTISSEGFFTKWGDENAGIDSIILADGTVLDRETIRGLTTTVGVGLSLEISDSALNDVIRGGAGRDEITISQGNDTIIYGAGDGLDILTDISGSVSERDVLVLAGLNPDDIELSRNGDVLVVKIVSTGETLRDQKFFSSTGQSTSAGGWGLDRIKFENGTVWNRQTIADKAWIRGSERSDLLSGYGNLADILQGHGGNDTLAGDKGSDKYIWRKGDGNDTIVESDNYDGSTDKLVLENVSAGDVEFSRRGNNLIVTIKSTGEAIEVRDQFKAVENIIEDWDSTGYGLEAIRFSNGVKWSREKIMKAIVNVGFDLDIKYVVVAGFIMEAHFTDELGHVGEIFDLQNGPSVQDVNRGIHDIMYGSGGDDTFRDGGVIGPEGHIATALDTNGHNVFDGRGGDDTLVGGKGHDTLIGGYGDDTLYGDAESDGQGVVGDGNDVLDGGEGNDALRGGGGSDTLIAGNGNDTLVGGAGEDFLYESSSGGNDTFIGGKGNDMILSTGQSSDVAGASNGSDTYIYTKGDGNDVIRDDAYSTTEVDKLVLMKVAALGALEGMAPSDVELSQIGDDLVVTIISTGEKITSLSFFDYWGSHNQGIDAIEFSNGVTWARELILANAWIRGTSSQDYIQDNSGASTTFYAGKGNDTIVSAKSMGYGNQGGSNGSDTFVYGRGDGNDLFFDGSHSTTEVDTLVLTNIRSDEVELSRIEDTLVITDLVTNSVIRNEGVFWNWTNKGQGIDVIQFSDGVQWDREAMLENAWYRGTNTADTIRGDATEDNVFWGGRGNDIIISGRTTALSYSSPNGSDLFLYDLGDGNDRITDGSWSFSETDRLQLNNINPEDVSVNIVGNDIKITITATGQWILDVGSMWERSTRATGLEEIKFEDGTLWSRYDIRFWGQEGSVFYVGTSDANTIIGSYLNQNLSGAGGNDWIDGRAGSDQIHGDQGNDTIAISVSNYGDLDSLDGGSGSDTVSLATYSGTVFVDFVLNGGEIRAYTTDPSIVTGRVFATLVNIENVVGTKFKDTISGSDAVNNLVGGEGDDIIDGRSGEDLITGGRGNDDLKGGLDNDTFIFTAGDGNDNVDETPNGGANDILQLNGIDPTEVRFVRSQGGLTVLLAEGIKGSITLAGPAELGWRYDQYGIEQFNFADGIVWNANYLRQRSIYDSATDGDDILVGTSASAAFGGGLGNDILDGGAGDDVYRYLRGDGNDRMLEASGAGSQDKLALLDINPSEVVLHRNGNDLFVEIVAIQPNGSDFGLIHIPNSLNATGSQGIELISFADGTSWNRSQIITNISTASWTPPVTISGTAGSETIVGTAGNDVILPGNGNDRIEGGEGSDTYIYRLGDGDDVIFDYRGTRDDRLMFGEGIGPAQIKISPVESDTNDIRITFTNSSGSIVLDNQFWGDAGIEAIEFKSGVLWDEAEIIRQYILKQQTEGNDAIRGTGLDDIVIAGTGNDIVDVGNGNDVVTGGLDDDSMTGGWGSDIYHYSRGDGNDTIIEGTYADTDQLIFSDINPANVILVRNGNDVRLVIDESSPAAGDGGSVLIKDGLLEAGVRGYGLEEIVFANGTIWARTELRVMVLAQVSTSGNDTIIGFSNSDIINGGTGNDTIDAGDGNDVITGGLGDDVMTGYWGNDIFHYYRGDGNDTIIEGTYADTDQLIFSDINPADVILFRNGNDVRLVIDESSPAAGTGSVLIKDGLNGTGTKGSGVEQITFADGTSWNRASIKANVNYVAGTDGNDTITGTSYSEIILAGFGNDTITTGAGSDTIVFATGEGNDTINDFAASGTTHDIIDLSGLATITSYSDLTTNHMTQSGANVLIDGLNGDTITIKNVTLASLASADFVF